MGLVHTEGGRAWEAECEEGTDTECVQLTQRRVCELAVGQPTVTWVLRERDYTCIQIKYDAELTVVWTFLFHFFLPVRLCG